MLTGKTKTYFETWLENQEVAPYKAMFWDVPKIIQQAYIIDFFDSIGVYIIIDKHPQWYWKLFRYIIIYEWMDRNNYPISTAYAERHITTDVAIKKANEIVNSLKDLNQIK